MTDTDLAVMDPAKLGYPPTLPLEVAMRTAPVKDICQAYNLDKDDWNRLRADPAFIADVAGYIEMLRKEGMSFKLKARLQAEELLSSSWKLIHNLDTPDQVKADLIKSTMRWAGYDAKDTAGGGNANTLSIQINL